MNGLRITQLVPVERVERLIRLVRGEKVLLDADLAVLYGVTTGNLNKSVKRNQQRFPPDFMFQPSEEEAAGLIFQSGRSKQMPRQRSRPALPREEEMTMPDEYPYDVHGSPRSGSLALTSNADSACRIQKGARQV